MRSSRSSSKKNVALGDRARVPRVEGELVEVVLDRLDLAVVAHLVAEPDEGVLDLATGLRDRVQVAERELVAGEGDVDDVLGRAPLELCALERLAPLRDGGLERCRERRSAASPVSRSRTARSACASSLFRPR